MTVWHLPFLLREVLGREMGLVLGSTYGTVLVGLKYPLFPFDRHPFHMPGAGGLLGLSEQTNKLLVRKGLHASKQFSVKELVLCVRTDKQDFW